MSTLCIANSDSSTLIRLVDEFGPVLTGRRVGEDLRHRIEAEAELRGVVIVDFEGVELIAPSFADELFAKLPDELVDAGRVEIRNLNNGLAQLARAVRLHRAS